MVRGNFAGAHVAAPGSLHPYTSLDTQFEVSRLSGCVNVIATFFTISSVLWRLPESSVNVLLTQALSSVTYDTDLLLYMLQLLMEGRWRSLCLTKEAGPWWGFRPVGQSRHPSSQPSLACVQ